MGRLAERSNNKTEDIANAIIQRVSDLNRNATTKFEETLKKLETAIEENLKLGARRTRSTFQKKQQRTSTIFWEGFKPGFHSTRGCSTPTWPSVRNSTTTSLMAK